MLNLPGRPLFRYGAILALPVCHVLVKHEHVEDMKKELRKATSICKSRSFLTHACCRRRDALDAAAALRIVSSLGKSCSQSQAAIFRVSFLRIIADICPRSRQILRTRKRSDGM